MTAHEILERRKAAPINQEVHLTVSTRRGIQSLILDEVRIMKLRDFLNELYPPEQK